MQTKHKLLILGAILSIGSLVTFNKFIADVNFELLGYTLFCFCLIIIVILLCFKDYKQYKKKVDEYK